MKRFQLLIVLAAVAAGLIWLGFYRSRHVSSAAITGFLPKETLALVHLPDINRSRGEFHQTDIYKIWTEPAVQDFLQKPRAKIPANSGLGSIIQDCESLQMKDVFLAVITIEYSAWKIVGGFRFKGDAGNAEKIVANWKTQLLGKGRDFQQEIVNYQGHQIQAGTAGIVRLSTVRHGQWIFVANDPEQLKPLLDRLDGRVQDSYAPLAEDDVFAAGAKRMPSSYTALAFARVDRFVEKLMPREEETKEPEDHLAAIRQVRSVCGATSFEGGKIRDVIFVGMPKLDAGTLTRGSLPIATKDAFLYAAGLLSFTKPAPLSSSQTALGWIGGLQKMTSALSSNGLTLEDWNRAFGPEFSWIGNWPSTSHWPSLFAALPVKDSAQANKILTAMTAADADSGAWTHQERDGVQYFSTRTGGPLFSFSPTIGLSDRMLVAGADATSVEAAMKRSSTGNSELAASENFTEAERAVPTAEQGFAYIDPALIYARIDATLRPMLFMGAAFLPGIADTVDLNKLPAPETVIKHLSPIVMSQRYDGDGYISESVGPVTVYQAIVGVGGLGGAAAVLYRKRTHAPVMDPTGPPSASGWTGQGFKQTAVPSATPDNSPP